MKIPPKGWLAAVLSGIGIIDFQASTSRGPTEQALDEACRRYETILENIAESFIALDGTWRMTYLNAEAERITHTNRDEILGKCFWDVFPKTVGTEFERQLRRAVAERVTVEFENYHDAWGRWFENRAIPSRDGGVSLSFRDITDRRRNFAILEEQQRVLEQIAGDTSLSEVLDALCRMVERHSLSKLLASILILDRDGLHLRHGGAPSLPDAYKRAVDGVSIGPGAGSCGTAASRREPVYVADIATDPLWSEYAELAISHGLRACWSQPILSSHGEVLGTFAMYYPSPRQATADDLRLVDTIARTAAIAIERDRTAQAVRQRTSQFVTLLNEAPLGVYLVDAEFKIREVNPTALPVFGNLPGLIGRDFNEVVRILWADDYAQYITERFRHTLETGEPFSHKEHIERRRDRGVRECYEWQINRIPLPEGRHGVVCYFRDISAEVLAREAIAESEARFRMLAENVSQLFWGCGPDGQCDLLSRQWLEYTGIPEHEQLGLRWLDLVIHPEDRERTLNTWLSAVNDHASYDLEFRIKGADGIYRWFKTRGTPIRDASGAIVRWFGTCTEIDAQVKTEHALRVARDRFQTVLQNAPIILFIMDHELRTTWVLNSFEGSDSIIGKTDLEVAAMGNVISIEDATALTVFKRRVLETGVGERHEQTFTVLGELKTYDTTLEPIRDTNGQVVGLAGVSLDISERKQAEKERDRLEGQRQLALDAARLGWWHYDPESQVASYDDRYREIFGVTEASCSNDEILALIHPEDLQSVWTAFQASLDPTDPKPYSTEFRLNRSDGSLCWVQAHGLAVFEGEGPERRPKGFSGTVADVTARKEAEEALRKESLKTRRLVDSNIIGVLFANQERILDANDAFLGMIGYTESDLKAGRLKWRDMTPLEHTAVDIQAVDELERLGVATPWQKEFVRKDGSRVPVMIGAAVFDLAPTWIAFVQDMSRVKEVENELRKTDRRKDEFLAMLAHELRNPLAAISNAVNVASRGGPSEHADWSMDVIKRQMKHLTRLIDDLLDVSRINQGKIELRKDVLDVTPVLDSAVATVQPLVGERKHTFDILMERGQLWVNADPTRLEQVVVNLLNNAAKYSENQGHIWLSARNQGDMVVITVGDKGIGIPPEQLPHMFELFAQGDRTLARSEGGLGIGLTVVKRLVELHGGSVSAKSQGSGKGSEFTIQLPAATRPPVPGASTKPLTVPASKKSRILIVDDNVDTARSMAVLLKIVGHDVATAFSGPEAIEVARMHRPSFVLLDIGLPGMDGYEVASRLRQEECCNEAMVVAVSGYGQDEDRRRSKEAGFDHHLIKPLDHEVLLALIAGESKRANGRS